MDSPQKIKEQIRDYIQESAKFTGVTGITDQSSLVEAGIIDSLQLVRVVAFLEDTFGISIEDEEILPKNFESIDGMERLVLSKFAAKS
jgi:acyl carrier protein